MFSYLFDTRALFIYKDHLSQFWDSHYKDKIDRLVQERHNSVANALELCLPCRNPWSSDHLTFILGIPTIYLNWMVLWWCIYKSEQGHHWFKLWLVPCLAPSQHLYQCWLIVNQSIGTNFSDVPGVILWMHPANERQCYNIMSLLGFVRTRVLMSRSRLNNGATHGGWHFDIHWDFDTRGR